MVKSLFLIGLLCSVNVNNISNGANVAGSESVRVSDSLYVLNVINDAYSDNYIVNDDLIYRGFTYNSGMLNSSFNGVVNSSVNKYYNADSCAFMPGIVFCNYPFKYVYREVDNGFIPMWDSTQAVADITYLNKPFYYSNVAFYSDYKPAFDNDYFTNTNTSYSRGLSRVVIGTSLAGYYHITLNYYNDYDLSYGSFTASINTINRDSNLNWVTYLYHSVLSVGLDDLFGTYVAGYFNEFYDSLIYNFSVSFEPLSFSKPSDINGYLTEAYQNGYDTGYRIGLHDGRSEANTFTFGSLFSSIANAPIMYLKALFNFEFFGIRIYTVILGLLTTLVVVWLVKRFV